MFLMSIREHRAASLCAAKFDIYFIIVSQNKVFTAAIYLVLPPSACSCVVSFLYLKSAFSASLIEHTQHARARGKMRAKSTERRKRKMRWDARIDSFIYCVLEHSLSGSFNIDIDYKIERTKSIVLLSSPFSLLDAIMWTEVILWQNGREEFRTSNGRGSMNQWMRNHNAEAEEKHNHTQHHKKLRD